MGGGYFEVVGRAVGQAHALNPPVAARDLRIPAVLGVVRHLVGQVLPEPQPARVDTCVTSVTLRYSSHAICVTSSKTCHLWVGVLWGGGGVRRGM